MKKFFRFISLISAALSVAGMIHTIRNLAIMRDPKKSQGTNQPKLPRVSVLIPARNEATRISATIRTALDQTYSNFELVILDDASTDNTAQVVTDLLQGDTRARFVQSAELVAAGWLGKPWACQRLAHQATGDILVFVDADVTLEPDALTLCIQLMQDSQIDIMCPHPQQIATTFAQRMVQPLLHWSWLTTLPLDVAETSSRSSLTAGNGQLLMITREMYDRIGGHESVKDQVLEDINLVRAVKLAGGKGGVVDGSAVAHCEMYETDKEMIRGYTKSLWDAFGGNRGAILMSVALFSVYVLPVLLWFSPDKKTRHRSVTAYSAAALGRLFVAQRMKHRVWPDALLHPLSIVAFNALTLRSLQLRKSNQLDWKGREIFVAGTEK